MLEEQRKEFAELLEKCSGETLREIWLLVRHMSNDPSAALNPAELEELRADVDRRGFNRAQYRLA